MKLLRQLLLLYSAEGFLTILWILFTPSETGRVLFLWLSPARLALLALALVIWAAILAANFLAWRRPVALEAVHEWLNALCIENKRLGALSISIVVPAILLLAAALKVTLTPVDYASYRTWAPDTFPLLHSLALAFLPLLLLAVLMALEFAIYLALEYRQALMDPGIWGPSQLAPALGLVLIVGLTVFYWLVLGFQLRFFVNNPAWYWKFEPVPFHPGDLLYFVLAMLIAGVAYWTLIRRRRILVGLIALFLLGLLLQFSVGLMSGGGFAAFQDRYFSTYHKTYIAKATQGNISILDGIRQYEQLFGSRSFTNTKPPGLMALYISLDHLINGFPSVYPDTVRYERLSSAVASAFPALAVLCVFALYAFACRFARGHLGFAPATAPFLLVLCPNLILFSLFPDQAIYPLLFLLGAWLTVVIIQRGSLILALCLGMLLYLAVFFAFTMLPLYPFAGIYLALHYWRDRQPGSVKQHVLLAVGILAGTILLYLFFRHFLNYDFVPRFEKTVAINHNFDFYLRLGRQPPAVPESVSTRFGQIVGAAWHNNLDFAAAVGFPIYILFVVQGLRLLMRLGKGTAQANELVLATLLLSFILLNAVGTAQGEVPRLWLFWLPMVVMLAALELERWLNDHPRLLLGLAAAQLITIFLTFHFQDLRM